VTLNPTGSPLPRAYVAGVLVCFFLSGAAGLVYQVAWGKSLGLIFGNTVYATATVLAVFMGGLALGSAVLGRWGERVTNPVALYGWIELGVAVTGALSLLGLAGVRWLYVAAHPALAGSSATLVALRFAGAAVVLLLPTFLMGSTLPIMVQGTTRSSAELGARVSRLYWVNTLGAVAGTFAAGFGFLPELGFRLTVAIAVALNVVAGVISLLLSGRAGGGVLLAAPASSEPASANANPESPITAHSFVSGERFLLATFALVGATAMAYEVGWTRLLATTAGSSTYAFTLMLGTFLVGIVLGSAAFDGWQAGGRTVTLGTYAATQTATALAALAFLISFQYMPEFVVYILRQTKESFEGLLLVQLAISAAAMLPAAIAFGFNFPVVTLLIAGKPGATRHAAAVGRAYAANTVGAIGGAVLAGFWLLPSIGAFRLVAGLAAVNVVLALALQLRHQPRRPLAVGVHAGLALLVAAVAVTGAFYDRQLASFNPVLYWNLYSERLTLQEMAATNDVVFLEDGMNATISVVRSEDYISERTNGKVDASNRDVLTQLLMGHVGAVFHPAPKRALVIGFGSGMTVSTLTLYPEIEHIDCVEIEPAVIHAAPHLETLNRGVLRDPRVRIILEDARSYLLTTRESYDLIISEPSNPWIAGVATLFTTEYYREARRRLAPGGIFVQWVQSYSLFPDDFRMVLATFAPHFQQVSVWRGEYSDYLLLARQENAPLTLERLRERLALSAPLRADFDRLGISRAEGLLGYHRLDDQDLRRFMRGAALNTDDHTRLEYNAPRALLIADIEEKTRSAIWAARTADLPRDVRVEDRQAALEAAAQAMINVEENEDADFFLAALGDQPGSLSLALAQGRSHLSRSRFTDARAAFQQALSMDPKSVEAARGLAQLARKQFDHPTAEMLFRQILARSPGDAGALEGLSQVERSRAQWPAAVTYLRQLIAARAEPVASDYTQLAEALLQAGNIVDAEASFRKALEIEPYSYFARRNLGEIYLNAKQWELARAQLEIVARFNPDTDARVYLLLERVYAALGRPGDAERIVAKGYRIFPADQRLKVLSGNTTE